MPRNRFAIQRCSLKTLAQYYGCSRQTMWRWISKIDLGPKPTRDYPAEQVKVILRHLGRR